MSAERQRIRAAFGAAAPNYDSVAGVQRRIARALAAGIPPGDVLLDAGSGTGFLTKLLQERFPQACIWQLDAALGMCRQTGERTICADLEVLPIADNSIELYCSSLAWQWARPALAAIEAFRVLKSGGRFHVATLGPGTLDELRAAFHCVDARPHVRSFDNTATHLDALATAGFVDITFVQGVEQTHSPNLPALLRELRTLGAHTLGPQRRQGMLGRQAWLRVQAAYEQWRQPAGLPVSYDVLYLNARKP